MADISALSALVPDNLNNSMKGVVRPMRHALCFCTFLHISDFRLYHGDRVVTSQTA